MKKSTALNLTISQQYGGLFHASANINGERMHRVGKYSDMPRMVWGRESVIRYFAAGMTTNEYGSYFRASVYPLLSAKDQNSYCDNVLNSRWN